MIYFTIENWRNLFRSYLFIISFFFFCCATQQQMTQNNATLNEVYSRMKKEVYRKCHHKFVWVGVSISMCVSLLQIVSKNVRFINNVMRHFWLSQWNFDRWTERNKFFLNEQWSKQIKCDLTIATEHDFHILYIYK